MKRLSMFAGWSIVLVLATTVTWQIVSAADNQVSERPIAPLNVAAPVIPGPRSTTTTDAIPGSSAGSTSTSEPTSTSTTTSAPPTTNDAGATSTSLPATEAVWQTRSVETSGGTVILRYRPQEVAYQSATPAPGFQVEVEKPGPPEVKVEFESESHKVEIEASWRDGDLGVSVSEEDED